MIYVIVAPLSRFLLNSRSVLIDLFESLKLSRESEAVLGDRNEQLISMVEKRRARALVARNINREISQLTSWNNASKKMVDLVHKHLEIDHVRVFKFNEPDLVLELIATSKPEGKTSQPVEVLVQEPSNLSGAIIHGEVRVLNNLLLDAACTHDLVSSETQSELIIPLRIGLKLIGLIDLQSFKVDSFDVDEIEVFQSLADHLSLMLDRTNQLDATRSQLKGIEEDFHNLTRQNWRGRIKSSRKLLSYKYAEQGVTAEKMTQLPKMELLAKRAPILTHESDNQSTLTVPISLRNQVFGAISMKVNLENIPSEFIELVENTTNRLAVSLENARLLEDIQERAEREHAVSEISSRIRTAPDVDRIMQTAVAELGRTLNVDEVSIQLKTTDET
jgi:GAF domain-containing protein